MSQRHEIRLRQAAVVARVPTVLSHLGMLILSAGVAIAATSVIPERLPSERYVKLRTGLPFSVATAAEKPAEEKVSWAQNLYLGSVARPAVGGSEKEWVIIKDRTQPGVLIELYGTDPNSEGYQLVKLEWSEDPKKTKATVKKGGEFATIEPDQAAFTSTAPPASVQATRPAGQGNVPIPGGNNMVRPPNAAAINRPPTVPRPANTIPVPQPQIRPPVQQPQMQQQIPQPGTQGQRIETRPRVRVINSKP